MHQFFKISTLILFLGIFLIPKNFNAAPILKNSCCSQMSLESCGGESGKKEDPCHSKDKKESSKDCQDCHSCASVGFFADLQKDNFLEENILIKNSSQKISFYITPEFSDFASKIWQPPKII
ncbi:hypothetical protein [Frigoriflavimonas asaccharolytica]|uniref:Uncharacterized protein n=1 Tax=Frigoriflavimonas asaccharolytica TaxID=2735899 RepID=A0A8J8K7I6_9FLAO|nr:hypothetical protein [Frigoriflavimonas asaccharolytica]NRS90992.1 hypothetical protein [Frigoriflavimonas asaccharolytica]